jgi:ribosomal protein S21
VYPNSSPTIKAGDTVCLRGSDIAVTFCVIGRLRYGRVRAITDDGGREVAYYPENFEITERPKMNGKPVVERSAPVPRPKRNEPAAQADPPYADSGSVVLRSGEPIDAALKRLKKSIDRGNVMREYRRHTEFIPKPKHKLDKSRRARARRAASA